MDLALRNHRVLVTAGAAGIGLATVKAFLREGARVHPDSHLRVLFAVNAAALLVLGLFADTILAWCGLAFPA